MDTRSSLLVNVSSVLNFGFEKKRKKKRLQATEKQTEKNENRGQHERGSTVRREVQRPRP